MLALYATNVSPDEVCAFYYWNFIQKSKWNYGGGYEGEDKGCPRGTIDARRPFTNSMQEEGFLLVTYESNNTSDLGLFPQEAINKSIAVGKTVYFIGVNYTQNTEVRNRECPPAVLGICGNDWWEIDNP